MKLKINMMAALFVAAGFGGNAFAAVVAPGTSVAAPVVASFFGGTLLNSAVTFVSTPSYSGWARAAVYDVGTGLDFYYQFSNDISSVSGIERLTSYNYKNFTVDAYQTANGFGVFQNGTENVDAVDRGSFGVVGFNFWPTGTTKIQPGTTSYVGILRTNAHHYEAGSFAIIDGYSANAVAFAPAVPEPETYAMTLLGICLLGWVGRRKQQKEMLTARQAA